MEKLLLIAIIHLFCTIFKIQQAVCLPRCIWRPHWRRPTRISSRYLAWDTTRPTALARCSRPGSLQASSDSSPVSERPRTTVSVGALHPSLQCWHAAASALCQPSPTCWPRFRLNTYGRSQLLARWPGTHSWILSGIQRAAQTVLGVYLNVVVRALLVHPAH